jgi:hypothetical protein
MFRQGLDQCRKNRFGGVGFLCHDARRPRLPERVVTAERSFVFRLLLLVGIVSAAVVPQESHASNLTGVALYACDESGEPTGEFWHTSFDPSGHPIGLTRWVPIGAREIIQFANDPCIRPGGGVSIALPPMSHVVTLFWQYTLGQFPDHVALNLFFNDDNLNPGISAVVPLLAAFTLFKINPSPTTLSLYAREVQNPGSVVYDDGEISARLGIAYYFRSAAAHDTWIWRPGDLIDVDRVGMTKLAKDGVPDAVMVFELVVALSERANRDPAQRTPSQPIGAVVPPLAARVGEDLWVAPPTPTLPAVPPTPDWVGASPPATSSEEGRDTPAQVPTTPAAEVSATPAEAEGTRTPAPDSTPLPRSRATATSDTRGAATPAATSARTTGSPRRPEATATPRAAE